MGEESALRECALSGTPLDEWFVVDVHGHLGRAGAFDIPAWTPEQVIAIMDRVGINVLCASQVVCLPGDYRRGNEVMADVLKEFPGRFIGYALPNPNYPDDIDRELDRCIGESGMKGIKTHTVFHNLPADAPGYWKIYEYAQAHGGLPILGHDFTDAATTERVVSAFPGVAFIAAHNGGLTRGRRFLEDRVQVVRDAENLYVDLAMTQRYYGTIEALVEKVGAEKIVFGSDISWQQATHQIGSVLCADISEHDKELILGLNAAKIFKLDPSKGSA